LVGSEVEADSTCLTCPNPCDPVLFYFILICRVGIRLPTVEVRFEHLTIEADCHVGSRALPTLPNTALNILESAIGKLGITMSKRTKLTILKDASGIIKPSRYIN
jgi:hypothetical protein